MAISLTVLLETSRAYFCQYRSAVLPEQEGEEWFNVGCSKTYIPKKDDFGFRLKLECVAVDCSTGTHLSPLCVIVTDPVIKLPDPPPRSVVPIGCRKKSCNFLSQSSNDTLRILSYNILADLYTSGKYESYCPSWALVWEYRRQNLLQEIIKYNADILCLQEVQSNHFDNFLKPELTKLGYSVLFTKRDHLVYAGEYITDGCATFYRRDRFKAIRVCELEFAKMASRVVNALEPGLQSVVNIDLRKVAALVDELENIIAQLQIPLLVCGDFNSLPLSDPHKFIVTGRLDLYEESTDDPYGIYQHLKLHHPTSLTSAYASFCLPDAVEGRQVRNFDPSTREPLFTHFSPEASRTLDYIFYTADSLKVVGLLELLNREDLGTGIPSALWSSDHMALMAIFRMKPLLYRTPASHHTRPAASGRQLP
ncbi:Carbon catabolite repressor 4-like protein [Quillaja saponaria]|uniref:Carbon catabolite repressor 4-like protein n=1 Tax=Quillaja saponaria TaxID=32244 RepID=A0AAD7LJ38_QUISA|nr:Carbon catabolite repressor 4-like protein [Quillaja saponaria]